MVCSFVGRQLMSLILRVPDCSGCYRVGQGLQGKLLRLCDTLKLDICGEPCLL